MEFLDKKEQVLHFELTSYGRHLLSIGKLKPEYYSFFDEDVLYNSERSAGTSVTEAQGKIKERVLKETPYLKAPSSYIGVETRITSEEGYRPISTERYPQSYESTNILTYPIGTADLLSANETPYWKISNLHGTASSASKTVNLDNESLPYKNIPQINMNLDYTLSIRSIYLDEEQYQDVTSPNLPLTEIKPDGTYLSIKESQILMHFLEENGFSHNDSFSVEVFLYDEINNDSLIPLEFINRENLAFRIENDILINTAEEFEQALDIDVQGISPQAVELAEEDMGTVEYYFDFRTDKEIPEEDVCNGIINLKAKDIFLDLEYGCLERDDAFGLDANIYATGITEDDIEDCD